MILRPQSMKAEVKREGSPPSSSRPKRESTIQYNGGWRASPPREEKVFSSNLLICNSCGLDSFKNRVQFAQHKSECFKVEEVAEVSTTGTWSLHTPTLCPYCRHRAASSYVLSKHIHDKHIYIIDILSYSPRLKRPFMCSACPSIGYVFVENLVQHWTELKKKGTSCEGSVVILTREEHAKELKEIHNTPLPTTKTLPTLSREGQHLQDLNESHKTPPPTNSLPDEDGASTSKDADSNISKSLQRCEYCNELIWKKGLFSHLKEEHPERLIKTPPCYPCKVCKIAAFSNEHDYKVHYEKCLQQFTDRCHYKLQRMVKCPICQSNKGNGFALWSHFKSAHAQQTRALKVFGCSACLHSFSTPWMLEEHWLNSHCGGEFRLFSLNNSIEAIARKRKLARDEKRMGGPKLLTKTVLDAHMVKKTVACYLCGEIIPEDGLSEHQETVHKHEIESKMTKFRCHYDGCGRVFSLRHQLVQHHKFCIAKINDDVHEKERLQWAQKIINSRSTIFACKFILCGRQFRTRPDLLAHYSSCPHMMHETSVIKKKQEEDIKNMPLICNSRTKVRIYRVEKKMKKEPVEVKQEEPEIKEEPVF